MKGVVERLSRSRETTMILLPPRRGVDIVHIAYRVILVTFPKMWLTAIHSFVLDVTEREAVDVRQSRRLYAVSFAE